MLHWFKYYPRILYIKGKRVLSLENLGKIRTEITICSIWYNIRMQMNRVKTIFPAKPFSLYQRDKIIRMNNVLKYEVL